MAHLKDTATAFSGNKHDGYCVKIERDLAETFNICFETKKLRDIAMVTMYSN